HGMLNTRVFKYHCPAQLLEEYKFRNAKAKNAAGKALVKKTKVANQQLSEKPPPGKPDKNSADDLIDEVDDSAFAHIPDEDVDLATPIDRPTEDLRASYQLEALIAVAILHVAKPNPEWDVSEALPTNNCLI